MSTFSREDLAAYASSGTTAPAPTTPAAEVTPSVTSAEPAADAVPGEVNQAEAAAPGQEAIDDETTPEREALAAVEAARLAAAEDDPPPSIEDPEIQFDPVKLQKANGVWLKRQAQREVTAVVNGLRATDAVRKIHSRFEQRAQEFKKTVGKDFDVALRNPELPQLHPVAAREIVLSEQGPAVVYHIAKNPGLAKKIAGMDPVHQLLELGKIKATVAAATTRQKPTTTQTKADSDPSLPMDEFVKRHRTAKRAQLDRRPPRR